MTPSETAARSLVTPFIATLRFQASDLTFSPLLPQFGVFAASVRVVGI
jgi:hypothetical protein